jgi:hypothetical protein
MNPVERMCFGRLSPSSSPPPRQGEHDRSREVIPAGSAFNPAYQLVKKRLDIVRVLRAQASSDDEFFWHGGSGTRRCWIWNDDFV